MELATLLVTSAWADSTNPNLVDDDAVVVVAVLLKSAVEAAVPPIKVVTVLRKASRRVVAPLVSMIDESTVSEAWSASVLVGLLCPL